MSVQPGPRCSRCHVESDLTTSTCRGCGQPLVVPLGDRFGTALPAAKPTPRLVFPRSKTAVATSWPSRWSRFSSRGRAVDDPTAQRVPGADSDARAFHGVRRTRLVRSARRGDRPEPRRRWGGPGATPDRRLLAMNAWYRLAGVGIALVGVVVFLERRRQQIPLRVAGWRKRLEDWSRSSRRSVWWMADPEAVAGRPHGER